MATSCSALSVMLTWVSNSFPRPPSKRAIALATVDAFSQLGNVAGAYVWPSTWGPSYKNSYAISISTTGLTIIMLYIFKKHLEALNKKNEKKESEDGLPQGFRYIS